MGYNRERIRVLENLWRSEGHLPWRGSPGSGRYYTVGRKNYWRFQEYLNNIYNHGLYRKLCNLRDNVPGTSVRLWRKFKKNEINNFLDTQLPLDAQVYFNHPNVRQRMNQQLDKDIEKEVNKRF